MYKSMEVEMDLVRPMIEAAFGKVSKKKAQVVIHEVTEIHGLNWSEGVLHNWRRVEMNGGQVSAPKVGAPWNCPAEGAKVEMTSEFVLVDKMQYGDKKVLYYVHASPEMLKMLGVEK